MKILVLAMVSLALLLAAKSCHEKDREIRRLNNKIEQLTSERSEIWIDSCRTSVYSSCILADCAVVSIEEMMERICRNVPEGL